MIDELKALYIACKDKVGFYRSDRFKEWFHHTYPKKEMHHAYGSYSQSLKTSDYCSIPVTHKQHEEAEESKSQFAIDNQPLMLQVMIGYIIYLEQRADEYDEMIRIMKLQESLREGLEEESPIDWHSKSLYNKPQPMAECSFCEETFEVEGTRKLHYCPKCFKPLKLLKKDKWRKK